MTSRNITSTCRLRSRIFRALAIFSRLLLAYGENQTPSSKSQSKSTSTKFGRAPTRGSTGTSKIWMRRSYLGKTSPAMQYLHKFLKANPDLLLVALALLGDEVVCQSSSSAPPARNEGSSRGPFSLSGSGFLPNVHCLNTVLYALSNQLRNTMTNGRQRPTVNSFSIEHSPDASLTTLI